MKKLLILFVATIILCAQGDTGNSLQINYETSLIKNSSQLKIQTKTYLNQTLLFFERQAGKNVAKVLVKIKLISKNGEILWSKAEEKNITESTNPNENLELSINEFSVDPEQYTLEAVVLDMGNKESFYGTAQISLRNETNSVIEVDNVVFFEKDNGVFKPAKLVNLNRLVTFFRLTFSIYAVKSYDHPVFIIVKITPNKTDEEPVFIRSYKKDRFTETDRLQKLSIDLRNELFEKHNEFIVSVDVFDDHENLLSSTRKDIVFGVNDYPRSVFEMNQSLKYMKYILSSDSIAYFTDKPLDISLAFYKRFWEHMSFKENKSGAFQAMREYFKRVQFSIKHFSESKKSGWKTPRGRIFITYGSPFEFNYDTPDFFIQNCAVWNYYTLRKKFAFQI
jgi:GWxTD domain-containing protein